MKYCGHYGKAYLVPDGIPLFFGLREGRPTNIYSPTITDGSCDHAM
jgi:hypothetical protein